VICGGISALDKLDYKNGSTLRFSSVSMLIAAVSLNNILCKRSKRALFRNCPRAGFATEISRVQIILFLEYAHLHISPCEICQVKSDLKQ
jgi:hypothetical protein